MIIFCHAIAVGDRITRPLIADQVLFKNALLGFPGGVILMDFKPGIQGFEYQISRGNNVMTGQYIKRIESLSSLSQPLIEPGY